jgi:hypothetical protein
MRRYQAPLLRRIWCAGVLQFVRLVLGMSVICAALSAQRKPAIAVEGYVTVMHSSSSFEIRGKEVSVSPQTSYGFIGEAPVQTGDGALRDAVQLGAYVQIVGQTNPQTRIMEATAVYLRTDLDHKLSGFGVIDKVISSGPEHLFRADGYILRITSSTDLTFADQLNSLANIGTNVWVRYEGEYDKSGVVVVSKASFLPAKSTKFMALSVLEVDDIRVEFPHPAPGKHK